MHSSRGNESDERRIGYGVSYIPANVRPVGRGTPSALLVRGTDRVHHFIPERRLRQAMSDEALAAHRNANARFQALQD